MKFLAFDYGLRRTGVAASDAGGGMAFPRCTLVRKNREQFWREVDGVMARERPEALVVGLALLEGQRDSETSELARRFARDLGRRYGLPVYGVNEELTSLMADLDLRAVGEASRRTRAEGALDQQAAVHILEAFLLVPETDRLRLP